MAKGIEGSGNGNDPSLVQIGKDSGSGLSRRRFLQVLGAGSAAGVMAGCAEPQTQNVFPNVKGDAAEIPGVEAWFRSTCTECSAGCGIEARSVDGRVVKLEGNPVHPVNRGSLCALGQSALQSHYDPDRVRQPLVREMTGGMGGAQQASFKPISWDEAYQRIAGLLKNDKKKLLITGETSGAIDELIGDWTKAFNTEHVVYEPMSASSVARASEMVYGTYGIPEFVVEKAEVLLNFGSDFLETWVSPCEYSRGWAKTRRAATPVRVIHIEPRLSLTGANSDTWLAARPGSETKLALYILRSLIDLGRGQNVRPDIIERVKKQTDDLSLEAVAAATDLPGEKILGVVNHLKEAKSSLVLAGGVAASTEQPMGLLVAANLLNLVLGNVGNTVNITALRKPKSTASRMLQAIDMLNKDQVGVVFVHGTNPVFSLPASAGFKYAVRRAPMIVSFSSHIDETAELADIILPASSTLESWGDARTVPGVYSLIQPAMSPVFDTRALGDMLLGLAKAAGNTQVGGGSAAYADFVKASWTKLHGSLGVGGDFERFWSESLERGGYFAQPREGERGRVSVAINDLDKVFTEAKFQAVGGDTSSLLVYPFPSVTTFDGRAANRPWMLELPDPITQIVWDSWAEIHPETAKSIGIEKGDFVTVRNENGEVTVPAYLTDHVRKDIIAVPLGHGHTAYGRYAKQIANANAFHLLPASAAGGDSLALLSARAEILRGRGRAAPVIEAGSNSQHERGLARTRFVEAGMAMETAAAEARHTTHGATEHPAGHAAEHEAHHEPKQMYLQREHPMARWGMAIDLSTCTGCSACVVACYAENNVPVVGKGPCSKGREMSWLRIERYYDQTAEEMTVSFLPMMCQHCNNAPCEPVCPVYATYHNDQGLNVMVYNRCVGTRYCSNNCSYKVRRFNWHEYDLPEPLQMQLNPDVVKRMSGVMEKCTFCVQRIRTAQDEAKDQGRTVRDGEIVTACAQACPTEAIVFGDLNDPNSRVSKLAADQRAYKVLDHHINTQPAISYLDRVRYEA